MIEIELFDGTVLEFPEGTSQDVIDRVAMQETQSRRQSMIDERVSSAGETAADVGKSLASGVSRGVTGMLDIPNDMFNLATGAAASGLERLGANEEFTQALRGIGERGISGAGTARQLAAELTGGATEYQPQTTAGKYAGTVGEFLPGAALGGSGGMGRALLQYGVAPGLASEAAGQMTEGTSYEMPARIAAAIAAPAAAQGVSNIVRGIVSPFGGASPERLALAKTLDDFGVPVTAGQRLGSEKLRMREAASSLGATMRDDQLRKFTQAALKTVGETADVASPEVLDSAFRRIGGVMDDAAKGVQVEINTDLLTRMSKALETYRQRAAKADVVPALKNINKQLVQEFRQGRPIPASTLQGWRSDLSAMTRSPSPATREAAIEALDALEDTIAKSLVDAGKPEMVDALKSARSQYRNLLAIEVAASRAGEGAAAGVLSPQALRNAVVAQGRRDYVRGRRGDIADLTRAAEAVIKPLPPVNEGGMRRVSGLGTVMGGGAGATIGEAIGGAQGAMAGGAIGSAIPTLAQEAVALPQVQRYLTNQLLEPGRRITDPRILSSLGGLLAQ
jgi:hypothetical protein